MSILIDRNTRVMTQGITGKTGQFHTAPVPRLRQRQELLRRRRESEQGRREFRGHPDLRAASNEAKQQHRARPCR